MSGDISLSQTLGGLRIANPDNDSSSAPSTPKLPTSPEPANGQDSRPLPSLPPSSSTATDTQTSHTLPPLSSEFSLGFNPDTFTTSRSATPVAGSQPATPPRSSFADQSQGKPKLSHRQSMPLAHQSHQQAPQHAQYAAPLGVSARSYPPQQSGRPQSTIYHHANPSSGSGVSIQSGYRYRDDGMTPGSGTAVSRSSSRSAAVAMQAGVPSRESSVTDRPYRHAPHMSTGNGPIPPRRSSTRLHVGNLPGSSQAMAGSPYGLEGGPPQSSEEWKEKGAAVVSRQDVDANGKPVSRVMRKGVKDFNFGRTLGEGSYSTVLAATDRQTLREYAIKVLDKRHIIKEKKVKYVNIEKDALNRLTEHPGIVRLYYTFQDERSLYFVLDLATGGELLGVLKKIATFDEECTRFYAAQVLDTVEYMHSRGVIHRDLKPENVLLDDKMHVKITDFGTAKILSAQSNQNGSGSIAGDPLEGAETDRAVSFVGTAEYVSPELLTDKNACKASDLWAFGCIVYQLLAGRPPFKASNEYQTFQKIVGLDYTFPEGFPEVARDLVERLLVLDPAKRLPIEHIKNHQFFDGIKWGKRLWQNKAPRLKSYTTPAQEPIRLNGPPQVPPPPPNSNQLRPAQPRLITELPPPSQLDIEWSPVLTRNNERILKLGNLVVTTHAAPHSPSSKGADAPAESSKKFSRFFGRNATQKRQRLVMITSSARIVIAAAGGDEKKAKMEIPLLTNGTTWKTFKDAKGLTGWCCDTRDKHITFEDPKATTSDSEGSRYSSQEWVDTIDRARDIALSHSMTNSYSGDTAFNELSSSISSPTSTINGAGKGGSAATAGEFDGVNVPRHALRRDDSESLKGIKRFSRRHSKNGLAAVF